MTFFEEAIIGEFISKVSDIVVDISKFKIKEAVKNRKNEHQSPESQIYNIIVDVLNKISYVEYENDQDKIYDAAEKILKSFKNGIDNSENNIKLGLSEICENVDENKCTDFKKLIYRELSKKNYSELYREMSLFQKEEESNKSSRIERKIDETRYGVKEVNEKLDKIVNNNDSSVVAQNMIVKKKSRTPEYADKWNANMFLNNFDKRDKKAGVNVKLREVYLDKHLPHYIWGNNEEKRNDLKELMIEYIEENNRNKMLLILGQPGIGKSTLITWITAHFTEKVDDILVYRFASDLKNVEWKSENITERILKELGLSNEELNEKILILDGYDEIGVKDDRKEILDQLYWGLVKNNITKCFLLIVTCRVNSIKAVERVQCKYITLQPWNIEQIESFCRIMNRSLETEAIENIIKNKEILGIPLILYMVLALNISIDKEGVIVDVYDKIFSLEGGIYDRCIDHKSFADRHRVGKMKKQIHQISRDIAIWMFENNPDEAYIPAEEYKKICVKIIQGTEQKEKDIEQDFIIGNFFKLKHCEGKEGKQLYFAHRSIYEYFVVEYIFSLIYKVIDSKEDVMCVCGKFLKENILSRNMLEYLKIKILNSKLQDKFDIMNESFQIMLQDGMTYHASKYYNESYKNVMDCEMNVLKNMLELIHLWDNSNMGFYSYLEKYIRYNCQLVLNLSNADLSNANLSNASLSNANLSNADLSNASLSNADLSNANLSNADLSKVNLRKADLIEANLRGANLRGAYLRSVDLYKADLREANLREADLDEADLDEADLREADLREANLGEANLYDANLRGANLREVELFGANLFNAKFDEEQIIYLGTNDELSHSLVYVKKYDRFIKYQEMKKEFDYKRWIHLMSQ